MPFDKGSLILIDLTAKVKDTHTVFDTTREDEAKRADLYDPTHKYEPRLVSVGEGWVIKGLDEALSNASTGDKFSVEVSPARGFGEREPSKVRMIAQRKLGEKANEIKVGDIIDLDERPGIIRYIGSGRVQVDFNHKYAGRTLSYDINVIKKLESNEEKVIPLIKRRLSIENKSIKCNIQGELLEVELGEENFLTEGLQIIKRAIANDAFKFLDGIKQVKFVENYIMPSQSSRISSTAQQASQEQQNDERKDVSIAEKEPRLKTTKTQSG